MRADIHHGPEHKLHKEAGYISARPNSPSPKPLATHGRSIHLGQIATLAKADPTRVHLAMSRLLDSGVLTAEQTEQAVQRRDHNGNAGRVSLGVLDEHARLTELGENVLDTIRTYLERT